MSVQWKKKKKKIVSNGTPEEVKAALKVKKSIVEILTKLEVSPAVGCSALMSIVWDCFGVDRKEAFLDYLAQWGRFVTTRKAQ